MCIYVSSELRAIVLLTQTNPNKPKLLYMTHELSTIWLPKQDLNNDNTSRHIQVRQGKLHQVPPLDEELQGINGYCER